MHRQGALLNVRNRKCCRYLNGKLLKDRYRLRGLGVGVDEGIMQQSGSVEGMMQQSGSVDGMMQQSGSVDGMI